MKRFKYKKNTMNIIIVIIFIFIIITSIYLVNIYGKKTTKYSEILINQKIDKVLYDFFNELITNDLINKESVNDILIITKNKDGEILTVNYDLEKTYKILTDISNILTNSISNLENGKIDVKLYDKYLENGNNGLVLYIPVFISSNNVFLNNIGPKIPVLINFNENILTNVKTKVTNYGFNNSLLEVYVSVEMQKLIITPIKKDEEKFNYDILIAALVVNGRVPNFYGGTYSSGTGIINEITP